MKHFCSFCKPCDSDKTDQRRHLYFNPIYDHGARMAHNALGRWTVMDPLMEKYYPVSPYVYCGNNPVSFVDPDGREKYRFDDELGTMHLMEKTEDNFDQVKNYKKDKETGEWKEKTGFLQMKNRIAHVEKGILKDNMNFKDQNNVIPVGGDEEPSIEDFEDFIFRFSDMVGKEMGGYYLANKDDGELSNVYVGKYKNSDSHNNRSPYQLDKDFPQLAAKVYPHTNFHTHPSNAVNKEDASPNDSVFKDQELSKSTNTIVRFIIITGGIRPIEY